MLFWLNGSESLQPCCSVYYKASQKNGGCYSSKGWTNSILMPIILEEMLDVGCQVSTYFWPCSVPEGWNVP
uniref:Uncharacterized protein n=1 Tax=Anguilla anguilla TaxID=7936 RepID=A0A0E9VUF2_ANGAN